jgi:hypothetical protein
MADHRNVAITSSAGFAEAGSAMERLAGLAVAEVGDHLIGRLSWWLPSPAAGWSRSDFN